MDGTLLNPEGRLTARTISALKDARAHGAVVTLSSGRMPCALRPFVKELGIDAPLICYNGALTVDSRTEAPLSSAPLSPEMAREIARACEENGADGVSLINTLLGMRIDLRRRRPLLANTTGGMSGPGVFPLALRMVYQVYEAVKIPIVGLGGVSTAEDVIEMMLAGATAVQVGSANLVDPWACEKIIRDLPAVMEKYRIENLTDIIGGAHG